VTITIGLVPGSRQCEKDRFLQLCFLLTYWSLGFNHRKIVIHKYSDRINQIKVYYFWKIHCIEIYISFYQLVNYVNFNIFSDQLHSKYANFAQNHWSDLSDINRYRNPY
jgi:hypothetical protein